MTDCKIQDNTIMNVLAYFCRNSSLNPFEIPYSNEGLVHSDASFPRSLDMMTSLRTNRSFDCVISKRKD